MIFENASRNIKQKSGQQYKRNHSENRKIVYKNGEVPHTL